MIEIIALTVSIFGHGNWLCEYGYEYPESNLKETAYNHIVHKPGFKYESTGKLVYQRLGGDEIIGQIDIKEYGYVEVKGSSFSTHPENVTVSLGFDKFGGLTNDYLNHIKNFYSQTGQGLVIKKINETSMTVLHKPSGTVTKCSAFKS